MLTLIKQTVNEGIVSAFWIAKNREDLYSDLHLGYPDPELKKFLAADDHKVFNEKMTDFRVGENRYTLLVG